MKLRKQMQLELRRIQSEVGITFVHVTHDQEEAMTMADTIAVMNGGGSSSWEPGGLYERPRTAFVAGFLGKSNLLEGTVAGDARVALRDGTVIQADTDGRAGEIAVGVRPEDLAGRPGSTRSPAR